MLATTAGFRDVLGYRNGTRPAVYDLEQPRPRELVLRRDRVEVAERLSGRGEVLTPLCGRSLIGKQVGDMAVVVTPNGKRELEVLKLTTIHDEAE